MRRGGRDAGWGRRLTGMNEDVAHAGGVVMKATMRIAPHSCR